MRYRPKTRMRPYQAQTLAAAFKHDGRYGVFLGPRTGKTKISIDFCSALFQQGKARTVLVVCQLSGHEVWEDQLKLHCPVPYRLIRLPRTSKSKILALKSLKPDPTRLTIVLINYQSTWRIEKWLVKLEPDVLILDEGHRIKNHRAKQSRWAHRFIHALDPYRLHLTGTPITGKPLDVFSQYRAIDIGVFGSSWTKFKNRYADFFGPYEQRVQYKNLPDLRRRARSRATVLTKEECLGLPDVTHVTIPVVLDGEALDAYNEMKETFISILSNGEETTAAIVLTQLLRLSQIAGGFVKTDSGTVVQVGRQKLEALSDIMDELIAAGEKLVVFAQFRAEVDAIEALCKQKRVKSFKFYGPIDEERVKYPKQFQAYKKAAVFVAQVATGAESIDLSAASYVVFYSWSNSLIHWEQCHDRIFGSGAGRKLVYHYLVAKDTIDEVTIASNLQKKRIATLLHNRSELLRLLTRDNSRS